MTMTSAPEKSASEHGTKPVSTLLSTLGGQARCLYENTKGYSPLEITETFEKSVLEYAEATQVKLDPLLCKLDTTYTSAETYLKTNVLTPYQERVLAPTEEYLRTSQSFVMTTRDTVVERVNDSIITPYQENVMKPTEDYIRAKVETAQDKATETYLHTESFLKENVIRPIQANAVVPTEDYIKQSVQRAQDKVSETEAYIMTSKDSAVETVSTEIKRTEEMITTAWSTVVEKADKAIDYILPEPEAEVDAATEEDTAGPRHEGLSVTTMKAAARLRRRASDIVMHSADRMKEIVHVDLIAYAKDTVGADEERLCKIFDAVVSQLPNTDTTQKVAAAVVTKMPDTLVPYVKPVLDSATPAINVSFDFLSTCVLKFGQVVLESPAQAVEVELSKTTNTEDTADAATTAKQTAPAPSSTDNTCESDASVAEAETVANTTEEGTADAETPVKEDAADKSDAQLEHLD